MSLKQEKTHFDTFGFIVRRQLFDDQEMQRFCEWFDEGFDGKCGSWDGSGFSQTYCPGIGLHDGFTEHYLADPRLLDTLENLMGAGFVFMGSDAQRFNAETPWHRDTGKIPMEPASAHEYLMLKVVMYLDDLSDGHGCLSIMPGSHRKGCRDALQDVLRHDDQAIWADGVTAAGIGPDQVPGAVATRTRLGDIIFFNQRCFHSSWGGKRGRRYLAMTFGRKPTEAWQEQWIKHHSEADVKVHKLPLYPDALLATTNPRLRRLIDPLVEKGLCAMA